LDGGWPTTTSAGEIGEIQSKNGAFTLRGPVAYFHNPRVFWSLKLLKETPPPTETNCPKDLLAALGAPVAVGRPRSIFSCIRLLEGASRAGEMPWKSFSGRHFQYMISDAQSKMPSKPVKDQILIRP